MAVSFIPSSACELLAMPIAKMIVLTRHAFRSLSSLATKAHRTDHVTEILFPIPLCAYYPAGAAWSLVWAFLRSRRIRCMAGVTCDLWDRKELENNDCVRERTVVQTACMVLLAQRRLRPIVVPWTSGHTEINKDGRRERGQQRSLGIGATARHYCCINNVGSVGSYNGGSPVWMVESGAWRRLTA